MSVVNIRHTKTYDTYVGRGKGGKPGKWGNPFEIGKDGTREEVIALYRTYLEQRIASGEITDADLAAEYRTVKGCWCAPEACHGSVIDEFALKAYMKMRARGLPPKHVAL